VTRLRTPRIARRLALAVAITLALPSALATAPRTAFAQQDAYKQHMENGVKLFQDKNYDAAIVEFKAAYEAKPKASPLVNIALCYKAQFAYPKAIASLEKALAAHGDTMDAGDKKAAQDAIDEMRKLLAYVTVTVTPKEATLVVDGEDQAAGVAGKPIPLSPGSHKFGAKMEGYATAEQSISVASGDKDKVVALKLQADKGYLTIDGGGPKATIEVDGKLVGVGAWAGLLVPGPHSIRMTPRAGAAPYTLQVVVVQGQALSVNPNTPGTQVMGPLGPTTPPPPPTPTKPPEPPKRGLFVMALASLVQPLGTPKDFVNARTNFGGLGGLRAGYRVNNPAAFDLMFAYANVYTGQQTSDNGFTFSTFRFGAEVRLMTSGKTVRFVGAFGGGFTLDSVRFDQGLIGKCSGCQDGSGANALLMGELGLEIDLSNVLLDLTLESQYQSSRGITPDSGATNLQKGIYDGNGIPWLGGGLRVGYAFW
jgi:hypothetical protein